MVPAELKLKFKFKLKLKSSNGRRALLLTERHR